MNVPSEDERLKLDGERNGDLTLPMVAPEDLGRVAAQLLQEPIEQTGIHPVEGPKRYSHNDVAAVFAAPLGRAVRVNVIPRENWEHAYCSLGFSNAAARTYARMTVLTADGPEYPGMQFEDRSRSRPT
jgi:uncharacterized protein YbjT (DUF2867 family)